MVLFWLTALATSIVVYVLLDGVDLGVGILFGFGPHEGARRVMLRVVAPVWRGNETWLISAGVVLWGAFPAVYSALISAFYVPTLLMLTGLTLRGVALRLRYKTERIRWILDLVFCGGSVLATFMQGMMIGALVEGLPICQAAAT
jgi:cytochrome bd ubiquinol oxidase subunit II